jgi:hypothetical protein
MTSRLIIGEDPGLDTGIAVYTPHTRVFQSVEVKYEEVGQYLEELFTDLKWYESCGGRGPQVTVVCENYFNSVETAKRAPSPWSTKLIGVTEFLCRKYGAEMVLQMPGEAKKVATDARLKHLGWYLQTEEGHANDAARHVMKYCLKHNLMDRRELVQV